MRTGYRALLYWIVQQRFSIEGGEIEVICCWIGIGRIVLNVCPAMSPDLSTVVTAGVLSP
jgi:hypothetical protein